MQSQDETPEDAEIVPLGTIRVETALSRYPVHRLARRGSIDINIVESDRHGVETRWEVDYSKRHGQPGPLAFKIDTLIVNRKIEEGSRPIPRILKLGSLKGLCRQLGMAETGGNTNQIKKALYQNAFAGITAKTRYRAGDGSVQTLESGFTRYSVIFTGEKLPDGRKADGVYIVLNDVFINVINGAMTRPLDYDYLKCLPPASQRFYEILSFQMYGTLKYDRPRARLVYSDLCARAPQTRHLDWESVRSQMNKVHRPHRRSGYIGQVDFQQTQDAGGRPDWIMLYQPGPKARAEYQVFTKRGGPTVLEMETLEFPAAAAAREVGRLERELIGRGVSEATARELARDHCEEKIAAQIERVDWLAGKKPEKVEDPAAYLVGAIKGDYAAPKGFVSEAERQCREEARQAKERQAAEERRRRRRDDARQDAERRAVAAYRESLTAEQAARLEADALARASADLRRAYETAARPLKRMMLGAILDDHVRRLLGEPAASGSTTAPRRPTGRRKA
jgi:hypothetical protein